MTTQTDRSTAPHAVERWSEETHYCPECRWLYIHRSAFLGLLIRSGHGTLSMNEVDEAVRKAARECGALIDGRTWVCDRCWEAVAPLGGYCDYNAVLQGRGSCHA